MSLFRRVWPGGWRGSLGITIDWPHRYVDLYLWHWLVTIGRDYRQTDAYVGAPELRTNLVAPIAEFLTVGDTRFSDAYALARGAREGVKNGDIYFILRDKVSGPEVMLLKVVNTHEKFCVAVRLWKSPDCPLLSKGWPCYLYRRMSE